MNLSFWNLDWFVMDLINLPHFLKKKKIAFNGSFSLQMRLFLSSSLRHIQRRNMMWKYSQMCRTLPEFCLLMSSNFIYYLQQLIARHEKIAIFMPRKRIDWSVKICSQGHTRIQPAHSKGSLLIKYRVANYLD